MHSDRKVTMDHLEPNQDVEVRTRFDGAWVDGFRVVEAVERGYRLRRLVDGAVLPEVMAAHELRATGRTRATRTWSGAAILSRS